MKYPSLVIILLLSVLCCSSCKKKKQDLPGFTQEGKNVLACYINNEAYITTGKPSAAPNMGIIGGVPDGVLFDFYGVNGYISAYKDYKSNNIDLTILDSDSTGTYMLDKKIGRGAVYTTSQAQYATDSLHPGHLTIVRFDQSVIAGTFDFDAINSTGQTVHITDGRFDIQR